MKSKSKGLNDKGTQSEGLCLDPDDRRRRIAESAYFMAKSRGFSADAAISEWLEAEAAIDRIYPPQNFTTKLRVH